MALLQAARGVHTATTTLTVSPVKQAQVADPSGTQLSGATCLIPPHPLHTAHPSRTVSPTTRSPLPLVRHTQNKEPEIKPVNFKGYVHSEHCKNELRQLWEIAGLV